jgi:hypothetical protein
MAATRKRGDRTREGREVVALLEYEENFHPELLNRIKANPNAEIAGIAELPFSKQRRQRTEEPRLASPQRNRATEMNRGQSDALGFVVDGARA